LSLTTLIERLDWYGREEEREVRSGSVVGVLGPSTTEEPLASSVPTLANGDVPVLAPPAVLARLVADADTEAIAEEVKR
jgi:hypothetical protein